MNKDLKGLMASLIAATLATTSMSGLGSVPKVFADSQNQKNVIFILADDLGWMDVALNGSTYYETPNIQRLAGDGMTFSNAYSHPLCSPTRSCVLTGQYPHRTGINAPAGHLPDNTAGFTFDPASGASWQQYTTKNTLNGMPTNLYTIGEAFKDNGYKTGIMGKIHLGLESQFQMGNRGFDVDLGLPVSGPGSYYNPYFSSIAGNPYDSGALYKAGEDITDRLAREADKFITDNKDIPFLLEVWDFSVHAPFQGKKEYIDYFQKKNVPDSPQNGNFHMAAMLKTMDDAVGKVLDSVEKNGLADKTMIVFMGDNGGNMYDSIDNHFPTNNYPLRQGKGTIYEGGIRVPCIVKVPGVTVAGSSNSENIHAVDFYPTLLEYAGIPVPSSIFNTNGQVLDGLSIMPLLNGTQQTLSRPGVFTNFIANVPAPGNTSAASINSGKWKLIINYELLGGLKQKYELYDLESNISETVNLATAYPEKVAELETYIIQHQNDIPQAKPKVNPAYNATAEVPIAYTTWDKWVKAFAVKVANDPNITGYYPKSVKVDQTTTFYEKIENSLIMKTDRFATIVNRYDDKIDNRSTPKVISNILYLPLKYVAEKSGFSYSETLNSVTLTKGGVITVLTESTATRDGANIVLVNYPVVSGADFMLPINSVQPILGKMAFSDSSGLIVLDETQVSLTSSEISVANRYIDSYNLYDTAYWKAINTISMVSQAENAAAVEKYKVLPTYTGNAVASWNFDSTTEGFTLPYPERGTLTQENGNLKLSVNTADTFIFSPTVSINASKAPILKLRYKNTSLASTMQVYWITSTDGVYNASKKTTDIPIEYSMQDFQTWYIDLSQYAGWSGTITQIRIDGIDNASSGSVYYDSIEVMEKNTPVVSKWTFNSDADSWIAANQMTFDTTLPGVLECKITAVDAFMECTGLTISTDEYQLVKIRMKNSTAATTAQVYFLINGSWVGNYRGITIAPNMADYQELNVDMSGVSKWTGQITGLRIDPADNASSGSVYLDRVEVIKTKPSNAIYFDGFVDYSATVGGSPATLDMASVAPAFTKPWVEYAKVALTSTITADKKVSLVGTGTTSKVQYAKQLDATKLSNRKFVLSLDVKANTQNLFSMNMTSNAPADRKLIQLLKLSKNATTGFNNLTILGAIINDTSNIWDVNVNQNIKLFIDNTGAKPFISEVWIKNTDTQVVKKYSQAGGYVFATPASVPDSDKLGEIRVTFEPGVAGANTVIFDNFAIYESVGVNEGSTYDSKSGSKTIAFDDGTATLNGVGFESGNAITATGNYQLVVTGASANPITKNFSYIKYGDVSGDGNIDVADMVKMKSHMLNINSLSGVYKSAGEINNTGFISISDLLTVKKHLTGLRLII